MISIVIPTLGRPSLQRLLDSLNRVVAARRDVETEIIICFDQRVSAPHVVSRHPVQIISSSGAGVNRARNTGAGAARGDVLWFLDDDAEVLHDDALRTIAVRLGESGIVALGGDYVSSHESVFNERGYNALCSIWRASASLLHRELLLGGTLAVRKTAWQSVGGFDDEIAYGGAETPFVFRLHQEGRVCFDSALDVHHRPGARAWKDWTRTAYLQGRAKHRTMQALPPFRQRVSQAARFLASQDLKTVAALGVFSVPFLLASKWGARSHR